MRNNLFRIFDKLGVSSRVELALYRVNSSNRFAEEARREIRKPVVSASVFNPTEHSRQRLYGSRAVRQLPETF